MRVHRGDRVSNSLPDLILGIMMLTIPKVVCRLKAPVEIHRSADSLDSEESASVEIPKLKRFVTGTGE